MFSTILVMAAFAGYQSVPKDWAPITYASMSGTEVTAGGAQKIYTIYRSGENLRFQSFRGIDGSLDGLPRVELRSTDGVLTWVPYGKYSLKLPVPSYSDYPNLLYASPFPKGDVESGLQEMSHALKRSVRKLPDETIAKRPCFVLEIRGAGSLVQELWIDKEFGLTLKQVDSNGKDVIYSRDCEDLEIYKGLSQIMFQPESRRIPISGIPSAEILRWANQKPVADSQQKDLAEAEKKIGQPMLFQPILAPKGMRYAGTVSGVGISTLKQPEKKEDKPLELRFAVALDSFGSNDAKGGAFVNAETKKDQTEFSFSLINALIVDYETTDQLAILNQREEALKKIAFVVQTDFLDEVTGDTVSVIRFKGRTLASVLHDVLLSKPVDLADGVQGYEIKGPDSMRIVAYRSGNFEYAIASTKMSFDDLLKFSRTIK